MIFILKGLLVLYVKNVKSYDQYWQLYIYSIYLYFCKKFTNIVHNFLNIQYTDLCNQLKWRSWKTLSITHIIFIKCLRSLILFEFLKFLNFLYLITYSVDLLNSKNNRALQVPFTVGACSTRSLKSEL